MDTSSKKLALLELQSLFEGANYLELVWKNFCSSEDRTHLRVARFARKLPCGRQRSLRENSVGRAENGIEYRTTATTAPRASAQAIRRLRERRVGGGMPQQRQRESSRELLQHGLNILHLCWCANRSFLRGLPSTPPAGYHTLTVLLSGVPRSKRKPKRPAIDAALVSTPTAAFANLRRDQNSLVNVIVVLIVAFHGVVLALAPSPLNVVLSLRVFQGKPVLKARTPPTLDGQSKPQLRLRLRISQLVHPLPLRISHAEQRPQAEAKRGVA